MVEYFRRRAIGAAVVAGVVAFVGIFVLHADARYVFDGLTSRALPLVIISARLRHRRRSCCSSGTPTTCARLLAVGAVATVVIAWGVAQWPYMLPTNAEGVGRPPRRTARCRRCSSCSCSPRSIVLPSLGLLYVLDQKGLLPGEGTEQPEPSEA